MKHHWSDPRHGIWTFLRTLIIAGVVAVPLWMNASNFDETEWTSIGQVAIAALGLSEVERRWTKHKCDHHGESDGDSGLGA